MLSTLTLLICCRITYPVEALIIILLAAPEIDSGLPEGDKLI